MGEGKFFLFFLCVLCVLCGEMFLLYARRRAGWRITVLSFSGGVRRGSLK